MKILGEKKIQPGDSLNFTCADSLNKTVLNLITTWKTNSSTWHVVADERDNIGQQVLSRNDFIGAPNPTEALHMNIFDGSELYARIIQIGEKAALYKDGKRTLQCLFD